MKVARSTWFVVVALFSWVSFRGAVAEGQGMDPALKARVDKLYKEAGDALDAKDFVVACPKLEEVTRIAPAGIGARLTLGECYEGAGKLASAWSQYVAAEAMATTAGQEARVKKATARATALKPKLATLTIEVPAAARSTAGLLITRDASPMLEAQWGVALPVDKGVHILVISAPGRKARNMEVDIPEDGVARTVTVEDLLIADAAEVRGSSAPDATAPSPLATRSKTPGLVVGSVGLLGLVLGGAFVGIAVGKQSENVVNAGTGPNEPPTCGRTAREGEDAKCKGLRANADLVNTLGNTGIGLLVGGGALAAFGAVLLLLPSKKPAIGNRSSKLIPAVSPAGGGLVWTGSF